MSDEKNVNESAAAGSSFDDYLNGGNVDPNNDDKKGQSTEKNESSEENKDVDLETQYKELEKKLGSQGEELGDLRKKATTLEEVSPILEKLNEDPKLAKAILDGKIDSQLLSDVLDGKVTKENAETISEANKEVKKDLGKKEYSQKTPEEIEKLIEAKVFEATSKSEKQTAQKFTDMEREQEFRVKTNDFIANNPDFVEYAEDITKFMDKTGITDIKIAYDSVKGKALQERYKDEESKHIAEAAKEMAANAGGGTSQTTAKLDGKSAASTYFGSSKNPNAY